MATEEIQRLMGHNLALVRDELERIRNEHPAKMLLTEKVLEAASNPHSPLHKYFTWDNAKAAHLQRLSEAGALIRRIKVTFPDDPREDSIPRYVNLVTDRQNGGGYREINDVVTNTTLLAELEITARKELAAWLRRHSMLRDLCKKVRDALGMYEPDEGPSKEL